MGQLIKLQRSVVVAADVTTKKELEYLAMAVEGVPGIGAFKVGIGLGLAGLRDMVGIIEEECGDTPIIYDHQKAGNDIPDMGSTFAKSLAGAGVDAAIIFPFSGPATQEAWTKACFDAGLVVLTGGIMTHPKFLVSEGGYISDEAPEKILQFACGLGVRDFVVPGNKIDWVTKLRGLLETELGRGNFTLYAPGFITQKGDISECGQAAGDNWHAIVGSAIYKAKAGNVTDMRQAAISVASQIVQ